MKRGNPKRKKFIVTLSVTVAVIALMLFVIVPYVVCICVYETVFGKRFETPEAARFSLSDFDGVSSERYTLSSGKHSLAGNRYYAEGETPIGVVIMAHGFGGGGHIGYIDVACRFVKDGFTVFAYDATGNDGSDGKGVGGLPQGVIDLCAAIDYVKSTDGFKELPLFLWGHSWGGYSVSGALNYRSEVKAVAAIAGFDRSSDMLLIESSKRVGVLADITMPYVNSYERIKFKKYAKSTAMSGFKSSDAGVYIVHGGEDKTVPASYGYDKYHAEYGNNARFVFKKYDDRGHDVFRPDGELDTDLLDDIARFFKEYI